MYWYDTVQDMRNLDTLQKSLISSYADYTGVQAAQVVDLEAAFEAKDNVEDYYHGEYDKCVKERDTLTWKKNFWKVVGIINGALVVVLAGAVYVLIAI